MGDNVLSLVEVQHSFGERPILDNLTLGINRGDKTGLIGNNGAGKSTLLKVIGGLILPDDGQVILRSGERLHFLQQVPDLPGDQTPRMVLKESLKPLIDAVNAYEEASSQLSGDTESLLAAVEQLNAWDWEHKLKKAAQMLEIENFLDQNISNLSGGQQKRVDLARMILIDASIILLDEPTNHLDAGTTEWLEQWLRSTDKTVLVVTHDRYFLENVVDRIAELREGQVRIFPGTYSAYLEARMTEDEYVNRVRHRRLRLLQNELAWARKSPSARTTKSKSRLSRLDNLKSEVRDLRVNDEASKIQFNQSPRLGKTILELVDVRFQYPNGDELIHGLSLILRKGERFGIIGPNGCGKTTLMRLLEGSMKESRGTIRRGKNTLVELFDQHRAFLDPEKTLHETLIPEGGDFVFPPNEERVHIASWLTRFGFRSGSQKMKVKSLSGGERNRLAISAFVLKEANLLLLDEPTNDLDIFTLNLLENALTSFDGCVIVISHDRYFLDKVVTGIIAYDREDPGGQVQVYQGDYTTYRRVHQVEAEKRKATARLKTTPKHVETPKTKKSRLTYGEKIEFEGLEDRVEEADQRVAELESKLGDPELWTGDGQQGRALQEELNAAKEAAMELMDRWEELSMKAEA